MRALSLQQPYASAIISGPKRIENRPRKMGLNAGDWIWIHASQRFYFSQGEWGSPIGGGLRREWPGAPQAKKSYPRGVILGAVLLGETIKYLSGRLELGPTQDQQRELEQDPWAFGPWCTRIEATVALPEPVPASGRLGLWTPPEDVLERCCDQTSKWSSAAYRGHLTDKQLESFSLWVDGQMGRAMR